MLKVMCAAALKPGYWVAMVDTADMPLGLAETIRENLTAREPLDFEAVAKVEVEGRYVHVYWNKMTKRHRYPSQRKFLVFTGDQPARATPQVPSKQEQRKYMLLQPKLDFGTQLKQATIAGRAAATESNRRAEEHNAAYRGDTENAMKDYLLCGLASANGASFQIGSVRAGYEERVMEKLLHENGFNFDKSRTHFDPIPGHPELTTLVNFNINVGDLP